MVGVLFESFEVKSKNKIFKTSYTEDCKLPLFSAH